MISVNSLFILSYYSNIWIQSIFVLKSEWWKTVMFSNIGSPRDIYEKTHFIFKTMIAYKNRRKFFFENEINLVRNPDFFLKTGCKNEIFLWSKERLSHYYHIWPSVCQWTLSVLIRTILFVIRTFFQTVFLLNCTIFSCLITLFFIPSAIKETKFALKWCE